MAEPVPDRDPEDLFFEIRSLIQSGEIEQLDQAYGKLSLLHPLSPEHMVMRDDALLGLSEGYAAVGKGERSIEVLARFSEYGIQNGYVLKGLGQVFQHIEPASLQEELTMFGKRISLQVDRFA